jgi:hypothetical protein
MVFKDVAMGHAASHHRMTSTAGALPQLVRDLHPRMR